MPEIKVKENKLPPYDHGKINHTRHSVAAEKICICYFDIAASPLLAPTGALVLMMVYYISAAAQLFQIFTQSLDAIDVISVTLSRLNSINAIDVKRCKFMLIEY